ncbi:hypothetical protein [Chitinophaga rhizosphaerae]|uniref:hypothetical protein n=1 Tax=Chitinophaga rhizosphaerae TaxID=1864947 RepID=UPI00196B9897|nr:hypothetical protein [Chitinophaga rhizosphaerae]
MKNKISDLRDHMFAALERLANENMTPEELNTEIERSKAISDVGKVIVESAKTEVLYAKLTGQRHEAPTKFLQLDEDGIRKIERPAGTYSNKSPMGIAGSEE